MPISYTEVTKPSTPSYSGVSQPGYPLLKEDGFALLQEDSTNILLETLADYTEVIRPT